ncbi:11112_t:CDS:2 [Entrophospora sp. SA101]|nr:7648_t:CDS:2 [Entrophospora sp. SA101]CAJ0827265.1 11112_t:CDS:2 [Entrophospora sp. SA101]
MSLVTTAIEHWLLNALPSITSWAPLSFYKTNSALEFDSSQSYSKRLDVPVGSAVCFEPGETKTVTLTLLEKGFNHNLQQQLASSSSCNPYTINRRAYSDIFGPTTGDKVSLGNTNLWLDIEKDYIKYDGECKFGGGKVLREGLEQDRNIDKASSRLWYKYIVQITCPPETSTAEDSFHGFWDALIVKPFKLDVQTDHTTETRLVTLTQDNDLSYLVLDACLNQVPFIDYFNYVNTEEGSTPFVIFSPKGIAYKPRSKEQLIKALYCVLTALKDSMLKFIDREIWFTVDFDDACHAPSNKRLATGSHVPEIFKSHHNEGVNIWSVGHLIPTASVELQGSDN